MLRTARLAFGALCVLSLPCAVGSVYAASATRDLWVEVRVNDVSQAEFALLHIDLRGHLFVRLADVRAWHMRPPGSAEAGDLVRIDDLPGVRVRLEEDELVLRVDADASWFSAQVVRDESRSDAPQRGVAAVFLDYNVFAARRWDGGGVGGGGGPGAGSGAGSGASGSGTYSALVQAGSSAGRASFTSSWLGSRGVGFGAADDGSLGWHRLDTDLLLDFPEYTARLTFGDSVTSAGTSGQSVRFTGVHWATDYATRPAVMPYSLPVVSGIATVPSSIELYVNQALVQRTTVAAGPFELNNIPIPVGQGAVDVRMRDVLGHVQDLSVPYLVMPQLIAAGVTTADLAAGAVRENYGVENFAYGRPFLSGGIQHGLNDRATLNASAELAPGSDEITARGGAAVRATRNVVLELTPAVSHGASVGSGSAVDAGFDSFWHATSLGLHFRAASTGFVELGDLAPGSRLHTEWAAQASTQVGCFGSLGVLYAWRRTHAAPTAATTMTYNVSVRQLGSIGVFLSSTHSGSSSDVIAGVTFTRYLGKAVTASVSGTVDNGASTVEMQVGQTAPPDAGWGWELAHARGGIDTDGARIDARSPYGTGSGEIDSMPSGMTGLLAWQGGFLWAGGRAWPAQTLTGPAALVEVPDLGGIQVLHDGQPVGRTDSAGRILVPALRPFEDNAITIVPEDLPLTAMVESEKLIVRPYSHGVVRGVVNVAGGESQVFVLRLGEHELVPAGAVVALGGRTFPVGTQGLAQLPVGRGEEGVVSWRGSGAPGAPGAPGVEQRCRVRVPGLPGLPGVDGEAVAGPVELDCERLQ